MAKLTMTIIGAALLAVGVLGQTWKITPQEAMTETCLGKELSNGRLVLTWRKETQHFYMEGTQSSVEVWREIYAAPNGVVVLERRINADYIPANTTTEPERIEWPEIPKGNHP